MRTGGSKNLYTCQSKMNRFLSPVFFLRFSWPRFVFVCGIRCENPRVSRGGWLVQPRVAMAILPVWEHSEVKWWMEEKKSQRFSGGNPRSGDWENGMGKWRLQKLFFKEPFWRPRPQGAFVFFLLVLFVEKKKSDIYDMIHVFLGCLKTWFNRFSS